MKGILYFSGTGNSLDISRRIQEALGGEIRFIPNYVGNGGEYDMLILVAPIYSWGLPAHVYDLIPLLDKHVPVYIVLSYGGMRGGADRFSYEYALENGLNIQGVYVLKMPENYTLTFSTPDFYNRGILKAAPKQIAAVIEGIRAGENHIPKPQKTKKETYLNNRNNWYLTARDFSATDACIACGKCAQICPVQNISLKDGKISFSDSCISCLACYHRCPRKAIIYKGRQKKDRYVNPNVSESDIGKDF